MDGIVGFTEDYLAWEGEFGAERCLNDDHPKLCRCHVLGRQAADARIFEGAPGPVYRRGGGFVPSNGNEKAVASRAVMWLSAVKNDRAVPETALLVGEQLARLAEDGLSIRITVDSLSDAVGRVNEAGHRRSYTVTGIEALERHGWLEVVKPNDGLGGKGNVTTYRLVWSRSYVLDCVA